MKLQPENRVSMVVAQARALRYLEGRHRLDYSPASAVAAAIWPCNDMKAQGAGAAASRILKALEKGGLVRWSSSSDSSQWGWQITSAGRSVIEIGRRLSEM